MTLIELLIVITIVAGLTAMVIPMARFNAEERRIREAARSVNAYLGSARARALETGRPCGVMFDRMRNRPGACVVMHQVEVPPPYGGETMDSCAQVQITAPGAITVVKAVLSPAINANLVAAGDQMQLNGQGPWYTITSVAASQLMLAIDTSSGIVLPWPTSSLSGKMSYQIQRRPVKANAQPLQLPVAAIIDLNCSGSDAAPTLLASSSDTSPVVVTFGPNGAMDRVYLAGTFGAAIRPLFLMVGKLERYDPNISADGLANWQDPHNLWIVLTPQTGLVTSAAVSYPCGNVTQSRQYAQQNMSRGGR